MIGTLPSPCDGRLQALDRIERGSILQAKGRPYAVAELLGPAGTESALEGGWAWTIYLSPRDYHRVHSPLSARLTAVDWIPGELFSVGPRVLARRPPRCSRSTSAPCCAWRERGERSCW